MAPCPSPLIFVDDSLPGISRKRSGKGWSYYDAEGQLIRDQAERKRLNAIALPPAFADAWFCPAPNGHILATGLDAKGRKQYRYHPQFRAARESEKFDRCAVFGNLLPVLRKRVEEDLQARSLTRERTIAGVVRLLDLGLVRVGNKAYSQLNNSFGATTLRKRHADVSGHSVLLRYKGKSGQLQEIKLTDRNLARFVRRMQDLPGQNLFQYFGDDGDRHNVGSSEVNAYIAETMGHHFTAKNFRTWHASVLAFSVLAEGPGVVSIKDLLDEVAGKLGNTPAVARKSYIHPAVTELVGDQEAWRATLQLPRSTRYLSRQERGLIAYLEAAPSAEDLLAA
ncbi:DNA topoisomerase IB [Allopontixanthobacter sp.]|uniref:DNA topoisomerase IB n=1 Tax=Allopontixanthobacter sp. TaxID=2906452 RepID=UPI002AB9AB4F|nr:DNA topoisomerase IB [Allopontixanthobacter sp.]MDZ4308121.1 DNA topoisomerase IB [Allopontixanthobacter sp.]